MKIYTRRGFTVSGQGLKRATFWLDVQTLTWIKTYARRCGISQGALLNAVLADYMARKCVPSSEPRAVAALEEYARILLAKAPDLRY